jgi:hypothetical protein
MERNTLFYLKKATYPKLIKMLFANMGINVEPKTVSSLQDKHIEFGCQTLTDILGISNERPRVIEMKSIPIIDGFVYDKTISLHTNRHDFAHGAKIRIQNLLI